MTFDTNWLHAAVEPISKDSACDLSSSLAFERRNWLISQRLRVAPREFSFFAVARPIPLAAPLFGISLVCLYESMGLRLM